MTDTKKTIDELKRLIEPDAGKDDIKPAPPPSLADVLYVEPAPDGAHRNCKNCVLWVPVMEACTIHGSAVDVTEDSVCGYHVFGPPSKQWKDFKGIQVVNPKFSGLIHAKGGTACENCRYYNPIEEEEGVCSAVFKKERTNAHVHPKGCCTRWTKQEPVTDPKDK